MTFMNIPLPSNNNLPIEHLAGVFDNVTNSYKFYWFLAILDHVAYKNMSTIPINELLIHMVVTAWCPANYFQLWFGKQDRLRSVSLLIQADITAKKDVLYSTISSYVRQNSDIKEQVKTLGRFVPYRFLTSFLMEQLQGNLGGTPEKLIMQTANQKLNQSTKPPLYGFIDNNIKIHPNWFAYLQQHHHILTGFCLWHLTNYLQKHNPNVPNIVGKLFPPEKRDMKQANAFWEIVFNTWGTVDCIYSQQTMQQKNYSLDHFLPWRFVSHDYVWNIIPVPKDVNSSKSDTLPNMDDYFKIFAKLQYEAFQTVAMSTKKTLVEDYTILFKEDDVNNIKQMSIDEFSQKLYDVIAPQIQVARNMGFATNWVYK